MLCMVGYTAIIRRIINGTGRMVFFLFEFFCDSFQASLLFSAENKSTPDRIRVAFPWSPFHLTRENAYKKIRHSHVRIGRYTS